MVKLVFLVCWFGVTFCVAADTGSSPEFRLDLRGLGPWQRHTAAASETLTYSSAWATNAAAGAKAVVKVMPVLKTKPKYLVIDLSGGTNATHYPISYLDEVPGGSWSDEYKTSKLVLRHIPAGSFIMGGRATDYPGAVNTNLHMVTITRDFYMGVFEVTQRQWELVMGNRPSRFVNDSCYSMRPVERTTYKMLRGGAFSSTDVEEASFIGVLRRRTDLHGIDLPSEAQWEYACRCGNSTALNNGKNLSGVETDVELNKIARYRGNSGFSSITFQEDDTKGTSKVGMFIPNGFGLYDMHGNVTELCMDGFIPVSCAAVDPMNPLPAADRACVYRGGSWAHAAYGCTCGRGCVPDISITTPSNHAGFRLCLQGGDIPDFAAASTLVNESGTGSQSWTPIRSGAYYLTHSVMNGATNVQLQSAWFEVSGCQLALEPQGELTNGVSVAITGAGEGETVYYTTNGLAPSTASTEYTGPFSLSESVTVRAVAYNTQGVASEEATTSFTLHDALSVVGAVARPRYPWNGMVDVDCEIKGDPEAKYEVELVVKDLEGGTNLTVRTVCVAPSPSPSQNKDGDNFISDGEGAVATQIVLATGTHRLTWNADVDIPHDHDFPRVAVTVKATKQRVLAGYARQFAISTDGYAGEETLADVPVLVRLSTAIDGFDYRDFASPSNGADLAFFDANEQALPYEIDEWHTNGESLVWVKLPELKKGTRFTCAYGKPTTNNQQPTTKHEVWREYAGVWHMNEDSGTAFDSTEHGLDALPSCGTNKLADISQMVAYENGACGRARVNATDSCYAGNFLAVPSYDALSLSDHFCVFGWFNANIGFAFQGLFVRNDNRNNDENGWLNGGGWGAQLIAGTTTNMYVIGGSNELLLRSNIPDMKGNWVCLTFEYAGTNATLFTNGVYCAQHEINMVSDNGSPLGIGGWPNGRDGAYFNGQYDEIRLRGGSLSADRIKADYDMIANRAFCTYGAVTKGAGK